MSDPYEFRLTIGGVVVPVMSGRLVRNYNSLADSWTGEIDWYPGRDPKLDWLVRPYGYEPCTLHLGGKLVGTGTLYTVNNKISAGGGITKELICYSKTADLIDSNFEPGANIWYENGSMESICRDILTPRGFEWQVIGAGKFQAEYIECAPEEKIADFLIRLAQQRGLLATNDEYSRVIFRKGKNSGRSVGVIRSPDTYATDWAAGFDGRKRFYKYWGVGQSGDADDIFTSATDMAIPHNRVSSYNVEDSGSGDISESILWKRSKQLADALKIPYPVSGWYAPNGELWGPNQLVTLYSPAIHLPNGFDFLVRSAEQIFESSGHRTNLELVPPQCYTGEDIPEIWNQMAPIYVMRGRR